MPHSYRKSGDRRIDRNIRFTGYENPALYTDKPESSYWCVRALMLEIDCRAAVGQVYTDHLVSEFNRTRVDIIARCQGFEREIELALEAAREPYAEFFAPDRHLDDIEYECDIDREPLNY